MTNFISTILTFSPMIAFASIPTLLIISKDDEGDGLGIFGMVIKLILRRKYD